MRCPTCGADVDADDYWCESCATRLVYDATPESEPDRALVPAAPPQPKPARYVPPPPPPTPPIPVVPQPAPAAPTNLVFPYSLMRVSKWWLLIGPALIVVAFTVAIVTLTDDTEPSVPPMEPFELYTAPSGAFAVRVQFDRVVPVHTGVVITDSLAADGDAAALYDGANEYRLTEVALPGPERPRGIDHCRSNAPDASVSEGMVDGQVATLCRWENRGIYHAEAYVRRDDRVFLIELVSTSENDDRFHNLLAAFVFMD